MNNACRLRNDLLHSTARLSLSRHRSDVSCFVEEDALLVLVQVLFEREDMLASADSLKAWRNAQPAALSEEQFKYARELFQKEGLADRVEVRLQDYRLL